MSMTEPEGRNAGALSRHVKLGAAARALLTDDLTPAVFLDRLLAAGEVADACRFLAQALPGREAVWWACLCVRQAGGAAADGNEADPLRAAERWVADPTEENRWAARRAAEAVECGTPAAWAAMAAFLSGPSLAPPGAPAVAPGAGHAAAAVAGAVLMAGVQSEPEKAPQKYRAFLTLGRTDPLPDFPALTEPAPAEPDPETPEPDESPAPADSEIADLPDADFTPAEPAPPPPPRTPTPPAPPGKSPAEHERELWDSMAEMDEP